MISMKQMLIGVICGFTMLLSPTDAGAQQRSGVFDLNPNGMFSSKGFRIVSGTVDVGAGNGSYEVEINTGFNRVPLSQVTATASLSTFQGVTPFSGTIGTAVSISNIDVRRHPTSGKAIIVVTILINNNALKAEKVALQVAYERGGSAGN